MTVVIIGILAGLAIPAHLNYLEKAKVGRSIAEVHMFKNAIDLYELDTGALPDNMDQAGVPPNVLDPWGNPYQYWKGTTPPGLGGGLPIGGNGSSPPPGQQRKYKGNDLNSDYDLFSMGKDGKSAPPLNAGPSRDDVVRAGDGAFVGLGSNYL